MNRNIIIAIIVIIIIALVGFFVFSQPATNGGKLNTEVTFLNGATLHNGDQIQFELKDSSGKAVANQNVSIDYDAGTGTVETYKIITDGNGKGYLTLSGEAAGKYDVTVNYAGNDQYSGCSAKISITIEEGDSGTSQTTESNSTASTVMYHEDAAESSQSSEQYPPSGASQSYYDPELNVYYDSNGIVIGGQEPGVSIYELRNRPPLSEE